MDDKEVEEQLLEIAREHFGVETLEYRKMDSLDFHEISVGSMRDALMDAFRAGYQNGVSTGGNENRIG